VIYESLSEALHSAIGTLQSFNGQADILIAKFDTTYMPVISLSFDGMADNSAFEDILSVTEKQIGPVVVVFASIRYTRGPEYDNS
jgi:hypothetical protein